MPDPFYSAIFNGHQVVSRFVHQKSITLIAGPVEAAVTTAQAKDHLRVDHNFDDALIARYVEAATSNIEYRTNRQLVAATFDATYDRWPDRPDDELVIPRPPLISVASVKYIDADGDEQTLSTDVYRVVSGEPAGITLEPGQDWPQLGQGTGGITVRFSCGYGGGEDVPEDLKTAILLMVAQYYDLPTPVVAGSITQIPNTVDMLIAPYRYIKV